MFDPPSSLPMRAAIASVLGGLFGVALILFSHGAAAQTTPIEVAPQASVAASTGMAIKRVGDAALRALRGGDPAIDAGNPGARGLRINDNGADGEAGAGLRWHMAPRRVLRSKVENPRGNDQVSLGLQVRF